LLYDTMSNMILVGKILVGIDILLQGLFSMANVIVIFPCKKTLVSRRNFRIGIAFYFRGSPTIS
jgi:hypothetical protein